MYVLYLHSVIIANVWFACHPNFGLFMQVL